MQIIEFKPKDLIFNIKVSEACKSCKRYGLVGCCPPYIGEFNYYKQLLKSYKFGKFFIEKFPINTKDYKSLGRASSLSVHNTLIKEKNKLFNEGHYFSIILGGGSCKLCQQCSIPCKFPHLRAIPIEATGIDLVATLKKKGIKIKFPVKRYFYRIGAVVFDD